MEAESDFNYDSIAAGYAAAVDTAPYNALYERPAMLSLLPEVRGAHVLDAGCGSGWYAEQLLRRGARLTAIDSSAEMIHHAHARLRVWEQVGSADVRIADIAQALTFSLAAEAYLQGLYG